MEEVKDKKKDMILLPLNSRVLFIKDEEQSRTKGGLILPDTAKVEVLTGRIIKMSKDVRDNPAYTDLREFDKVLVNYANATPVELTPENRKFFLPITSIIGIFRDPDDIQDEDE